ncbi:MAG: hypothetical protein RI915_1356 [Pseudomonadota bacterium]
MNLPEFKNLAIRKSVLLVSKVWPQANLRWRNRTLFRSVWARVGRAILMCGVSMVFLFGAWQALTASGLMPSYRLQWQYMANAHMTRQAEQSLQLANSTELALTHAQRNHALLNYQAQVDDLILAWPNSVFRMQLVHHLQQLAQTKNLHIFQMKFTPMPDEQGFEAGTLDFSLKGSQAATYAYWQSLNQLFQNGVWPKLIWRLLPTGEYSLEGQINLLWDAEDAFTDTGVELQAASRTKAKNLSVGERVLSDHSVAQMRLVGTVQTLAESQTKLVWTLLQSGRQISSVRPGQYLGIENRLVLYLDTKGLWLGDEFGQPSTLLAWEKVTP